MNISLFFNSRPFSGPILFNSLCFFFNFYSFYPLPRYSLLLPAHLYFLSFFAAFFFIMFKYCRLHSSTFLGAFLFNSIFFFSNFHSFYALARYSSFLPVFYCVVYIRSKYCKTPSFFLSLPRSFTLDLFHMLFYLDLLLFSPNSIFSTFTSPYSLSLPAHSFTILEPFSLHFLPIQ